MSSKMLTEVTQHTLKAGNILMKAYQKPDLQVIIKPDGSPVTEADYASSDYLIEHLAPLNIPIITEEAVPEGDVGPDFFIIDPLDGTRYFIDGKPEFAVLVALVRDHRPCLGVIHFPALGLTFTAEKGKGCQLNGEKIYNEQTRKDLVIFSSGFHQRDQASEMIKKLNITEIKDQPSILKLGYLARGDVDMYPRFGRTFEWDTAAGQIILEEAGCQFLDIQTMEPMVYGKDNYENKGYLSFRSDLEDRVRSVFQAPLLEDIAKWRRSFNGSIN